MTVATQQDTRFSRGDPLDRDSQVTKEMQEKGFILLWGEE